MSSETRRLKLSGGAGGATAGNPGNVFFLPLFDPEPRPWLGEGPDRRWRSSFGGRASPAPSARWAPPGPPTSEPEPRPWLGEGPDRRRRSSVGGSASLAPS